MLAQHILIQLQLFDRITLFSLDILNNPLEKSTDILLDGVDIVLAEVVQPLL